MWKGQKGTNPANVLYTSLIHPRFKIDRIAKEYGIRTSLADTYLQRAYDTLAKHGISREELKKYVDKYGGEKIGNLIGEAAE